MDHLFTIYSLYKYDSLPILFLYYSRSDETFSKNNFRYCFTQFCRYHIFFLDSTSFSRTTFSELLGIYKNYTTALRYFLVFRQIKSDLPTRPLHSGDYNQGYCWSIWVYHYNLYKQSTWTFVML